MKLPPAQEWFKAMLETQCPVCKAPPGSPCVKNNFGTRRKTHKRRIKLWHKS